LPTELAVVRGHEPLGGSARGQAPRPAEHGLHREVRGESARSDGRLQGVHVNVEFMGQPREWQELLLPLVMGDCLEGPSQHGQWGDSPFAVPRPKGLERHRQHRREFALSQTDRAAQRAKLVHRCAHDAIRRGRREATSGMYGR